MILPDATNSLSFRVAIPLACCLYNTNTFTIEKTLKSSQNPPGRPEYCHGKAPGCSHFVFAPSAYPLRCCTDTWYRSCLGDKVIFSDIYSRIDNVILGGKKKPLKQPKKAKGDDDDVR